MIEHSKTFYAAFRMLEHDRANAVYAIYAFCRIVDDYADVDHSLVKIKAHEASFSQMLQGDVPDHFMWRALADSFERFSLKKEGFIAQIEGQKYDMQKDADIQTCAELKQYCYLVAGSVSEMMLPLLIKESTDFGHQLGLMLGEAMQITNILRDVGHDKALGRRYLPRELMDRFDYTEAMFEKGEMNRALMNLIDYMISWAKKLYETVERHIDIYERRAQPAILAALYYYRAILDKIVENEYDVFQKRAYVSTREKIRIARSILREN